MNKHTLHKKLVSGFVTGVITMLIMTVFIFLIGLVISNIIENNHSEEMFKVFNKIIIDKIVN